MSISFSLSGQPLRRLCHALTQASRLAEKLFLTFTADTVAISAATPTKCALLTVAISASSFDSYRFEAPAVHDEPSPSHPDGSEAHIEDTVAAPSFSICLLTKSLLASVLRQSSTVSQLIVEHRSSSVAHKGRGASSSQPRSADNRVSLDLDGAELFDANDEAPQTGGGGRALSRQPTEQVDRNVMMWECICGSGITKIFSLPIIEDGTVPPELASKPTSYHFEACGDVRLFARLVQLLPYSAQECSLHPCRDRLQVDCAVVNGAMDSWSGEGPFTPRGGGAVVSAHNFLPGTFFSYRYTPVEVTTTTEDGETVSEARYALPKKVVEIKPLKCAIALATQLGVALSLQCDVPGTPIALSSVGLSTETNSAGGGAAVLVTDPGSSSSWYQLTLYLSAKDIHDTGDMPLAEAVKPVVVSATAISSSRPSTVGVMASAAPPRPSGLFSMTPSEAVASTLSSRVSATIPGSLSSRYPLDVDQFMRVGLDDGMLEDAGDTSRFPIYSMYSEEDNAIDEELRAFLESCSAMNAGSM